MPGRISRPRVDPDLVVAGVVVAWIGLILTVDAAGPAPLGISEPARQLALGVSTWAVLGSLLARETALVRTQTLLVVFFASIVEYTFSPLLGAYVYRIGTVPAFVPPGHGLVYLAALVLSRSRVVRAHARLLIAATVVLGGSWALYGLLLAQRRDVLGAFWFCCLLGFLILGRAPLLYVGAFAVVTYLELLGTHLGTWAWRPDDPVLHLIGQGNPPSGAAGGYGWFDLYATALARPLIDRFRRHRPRRPQRPPDVTTRSRPGVATQPSADVPGSADVPPFPSRSP